MFLNTYTGVRNVSRELVAILNLMGANERHVLTKVVLPSADHLGVRRPAHLGSLRVDRRHRRRADGLEPGARFPAHQRQGQFDTAGVFAALIAIMALAFILNTAVKYAEGKMMPWKSAEEDREVTV